ncbi:Uma2 family endonuclease [Hydrogenivirga sp. 128-5-R1-1]|uniref:Uma2 family endonuclease n=1 Tax=Hydrogenivirga sp. 128-5-R1-1 TaxID=392423 RepID=UPI00015F0CE3|nr:Uma2 family endonuclease [Hydrogenivirga sp. 128-5-R1-1]EDP75959.1 hypothetical protein HG1285_06520 [Hydrogenivirga sp. 128-5-R1-1]
MGDKAIMGVPDLMVEIVSPSTLGRDTVRKKAIYERFGVKGFWLVYPDMKCVEVLTLRNGRYQLHDEGCLEGEKDSVSSKVIKGFRLGLREVFEPS